MTTAEGAYTEGIEVVWLDGQTTTWPTARKWSLLRAQSSPKEVTFTNDVALFDENAAAIAIIGAGTFRWISFVATPAVSELPGSEQ